METTHLSDIVRRDGTVSADDVNISHLPDWPRLMTRDVLAAYLTVSIWQVDDWRREGILPSYVPGTKRFDRAAVDRALDQRSGLANVARKSRWSERIAQDGDRAA